MSHQASSAQSTHAASESQANELTVLREQVKRLQNLATLGELTGTATHEFNNVLMTVINYAKLGLRNEDKASRDKALTKILEASERAAQITNTILAQARNRSDAMGPVDLSGLVRETLVLMQREMQKYRISIETDLPETATVHASGNQIQRLLLNLLTNSRQAIGECGTLWIRVASCDTGADGNGYVELTVRDSGKGIPEDVLPKIFDPYFSTKAGPDETGKGGTGLGLAACKEIIDEHKGRVRVESSVGRGTAFIIRLPISAAQRAAA
ncbi:two-component signal transduction [Rhodopirellula islandica]|uniref:histidine kinase n=1 Tax=Rhodopirellula islandica TaxID=595434 RepID=A0A0J1BKV5_RHOIS|nr:ATP-binding protein [Rhodopirellula islandica]KLU07137.1 two-component signal transduction [Rhodopirellula islandica]